MKRFKCAACGKGQVVPVTKPGRRAAFRNIPDLEVPESLELPTCEHCDAQWLDEDTTKRLDAALNEVYRRELSKKANCALRQLKAAKLRQWDLEPVLGLSSGYLSKVKAGKDVSPTLTAVLMLLAGEPARFEELKNAWRCQRLEEPKGVAHCQAKFDISTDLWFISESPHTREFVFGSHSSEAHTMRLTLVEEDESSRISASDFLPELGAAA